MGESWDSERLCACTLRRRAALRVFCADRTPPLPLQNDAAADYPQSTDAQKPALRAEGLLPLETLKKIVQEEL